jgi:hypothetical protein
MTLIFFFSEERQLVVCLTRTHTLRTQNAKQTLKGNLVHRLLTALFTSMIVIQKMSSHLPSKRVRKMSKRQRRAKGLPSEDEDEDSGSSNHPDDKEEDEYEDEPEDDDMIYGRSAPASSVPSTPAPSTPLTLAPPQALHRSASAASIASQSSFGAVSTSRARTEDKKHAKFDERFQTASLTNEEVLGVSAFVLQYVCLY